MSIRRLLLLHVIIVTGLFFTTGSYRNWPYKIESDGKYYYQYLISVWFDGDIDFTNNYNHTAHPFMRIEIDHYRFRDEVIPETGRPTNIFPTGSAILWSPFFLTAYGLANSLNSLNLTDINLDGWGRYFQYSVMYGAVVYSTLTILLIFKLLKSHFNPTFALITPFILFWATNWAYYSLFEVSMSHVYDLFTLVLFIWVYLRAYQNQNVALFLLSGVLGGLHVLVRTQNVLTIAILVGYYIVWFVMQHRHKTTALWLMLQKHLGFAVLFLLTLFPLFYTNAYIYGSIFTVPQGSGFLRLFQPEFYGVLLSDRNGLFSHHPILLLGVLGLIIGFFNYKSEKPYLYRLVLPLMFVFLVQLYVNSIAADWWAGHSFGQRRLVSSFMLFAIGLAYLQKYWYNVSPKAKFLLNGLFALFVLINLYVMLIHIFIWSYDAPHNIFVWMFYKAPIAVYLHFFG